LETLPISLEAVEQAARDLAPHLRPTPLQPSRALSEATGAEVFLKLESVQPIRAFKVRGALNKLLRMSAEERSRGVVTASGGNHGLGVAYAASVFGAPAAIYLPTTAGPGKVAAIRRLGAEIVQHGTIYHDAFEEAVRRQGDRTFVHAYDDPDVVAGQGTLAVELLADLPDLETVVVPVGGGGLLAGVTGYLKQRRPATRVVAVEPVGAACLKASLDAGRPVSLEKVATMADGLAASRPGEIAFEVARRWVDEMVLVEEDEMLDAIRRYFEFEHLLAEPAGAAALAGLLHHYRPRPGERVVVLLTGANVTDEVLVRALKSQ